MKRRVQGLGELARSDGEVPDGVYLVEIKAVRFERNRAKPFYRVEFTVLEPVLSAGKIISGRLYCTDYKKGAPFEVGCGCCHEQSTTPDERNTQWTV